MRRLGFEYWVHWLVYGFMVDSIKEFEKFLALCKKNGVEGVELPWKPLMKLSATLIAASLRRFGITNVTLCVFFGDIDPLDKGRGRKVALDILEDAMEFIAALRLQGIEVECIDGPWAYQIEKKYPRLMRKEVVSFMRAVVKLAARYKVICCLESLRPEENLAIGGSKTTLQIVNRVGSPWIKVHLDTFHIDRWGEDVIEVLETAGKYLGWFHVSGTDRHTPGSTGDRIKWKNVAKGLDYALDSECEITGVCFEAFSPAFRKGVPAIGAGFPKDLPPGRAIARARKTLKKAKII